MINMCQKGHVTSRASVMSTYLMTGAVQSPKEATFICSAVLSWIHI